MPNKSLVLNANLANIATFNPNLAVDDRALQQIIAGQITLIGRGSLLAFPTGRSPKKGCIDHLRYGSSSEDLDSLKIDGSNYAPTNLKDFAEIIKCAWMSGKCINFCLNSSNNTMNMLNVYPQCCCECEETRD